MLRILIASSLYLSIAPHNQAPPLSDQTASTQPAAADAAEDLSSLKIDDLIRLLPPAGCEWRWDHASGDGVIDPASDEMEHRLNAGVKLTDDQWRLALLSTGAIRFHAKWPRDEVYAVSLAVPRWLGITQIRLDPRAEGMRIAKVGELMTSFSGTGPMIDARDARLGRRIGLVPAETSEITFDVEVERGKSWLAGIYDEDEPPPGLLWKGAITFPVELVDGFDQIAQPVDDELLAEAVRDAVGAGLRQWGEDRRQVPFVAIDPDCTRFPALERTGLDIKVELLDGDTVIAESWLLAGDFDVLALSSSIRSGAKRFYGSAKLDVPAESANRAKWMLRLTGRADHISVLWHTEQRWSGSITIPWAQAVKHENKRTAVTGRGPEVSTPYWK